jgi:hypothetical protein
MKTFSTLLLVSLLLSACATTSVPSARIIERLPATEAAAPPPPPLPPLQQADLLQLAKQGLAAENIIGRLKESRTRLRLSASDVLSLKTQGVPLAVLDYLLDSDRQASADACATQINQRDEEARAAQQHAVQQAETLGWQRCQLSYPMMPFSGFRPFPYRR